MRAGSSLAGRAGRHDWRHSQAGQSTAIAVVIVLIISLLSAAVFTLVSGQQKTSATGADSKLALQAAQAGLSEFQNAIKQDPAFAARYCSKITGTQWRCGGNQKPPATSRHPAYVTKFTPSCQTTKTTSSSWAKIDNGTDSGASMGYQYVVNSSAVAAGSGTLYVYVTGRAGTSGAFQCTTVAGSFKVQGGASSGSATTINAAATNTATSNSTGSSRTYTPPKPKSLYGAEVTLTLAGASGGKGYGSTYGNGGQGGVGQAITITVVLPTAKTATQLDQVVYLAGGQGSLGNGGPGYTAGGAGGNQSGGGGGASAVCVDGPGPATPCTAASTPRLCSKSIATSTLPCVVAIAAGGGGGGQSVSAGIPGGNGGNGGQSTGTPGSPGGGFLGSPPTGGGGALAKYTTPTTHKTVGPHGGLKGKGDCYWVFGTHCTPTGNTGKSWQSSPSGGAGVSFTRGTWFTAGADSGGGGGGYYGGGSGGTGGLSFNGATSAAGGGGGSSYVDTAALSTTPQYLPAGPGNGYVSTPQTQSTNSTSKTTSTYTEKFSGACGSQQTFTIPSGTTTVTVTMSGAGGGYGPGLNGATSPASQGGHGGRVHFSFTPTPGMTKVTGIIGCKGYGTTDGATQSTDGGGGAPGGLGWSNGGGGGNGHYVIGQNICAPWPFTTHCYYLVVTQGPDGGAAGGGGSTALCSGTSCPSGTTGPLIAVAGGGGGGGESGCHGVASGAGGQGGGPGVPQGTSGGTGTPQSGWPTIGFGGYTTGGARNYGGGGSAWGSYNGQGGASGTNTQTKHSPLGGTAYAGGGGGAGYPSAGGGGQSPGWNCAPGTGGGGGSSWVAGSVGGKSTRGVGYSAGAFPQDDGTLSLSITAVYTFPIKPRATSKICSTTPQAVSLPAGGTWTADVNGGGGASGSVTTGTQGGAGAGDSLSVSVSGLPSTQGVAAVAGCNAVGATGGGGFATGGASGSARSSGSGTSSCPGFDAAVKQLNPTGFWQLDATGTLGTGQTVPDAMRSAHTGQVAGSLAGGQFPGPLNCFPSSPGTKFNGSSSFKYPTGGNLLHAPQSLTYEAWFKTTGSGDIIDFFRNGGCACDRALWVGKSGHLEWGTWLSSEELVTSPQVVNNGQWHMAAATIGSQGMYLYLDGQLVAGNPAYTSSETATGQWYVGGGMNPWSDSSGTGAYTGTLGRVAVWSQQLAAKTLSHLYALGSTSNTFDEQVLAKAGTGAPGVAGAYWELNQPTGSLGAPDATTANGNAGNPAAWVNGTATSVAGPWKGTLLGPTTASAFNGSKYVQTPTNAEYANPETFTISAWFKTSSDGGIMGLTGVNGYDRMLWVDNSGHLVWGTCGGSCLQEVKSPGTVTDTKWHFVVATIGSTGQYLYLDGNMVAANPAFTSAQTNLTGTWKVGAIAGGGSGWPDGPSNVAFTGDIGRAAYLPTVLSPGDVHALYADAGFTAPSPTCRAYTQTMLSLSAGSSQGTAHGAYWPLNESGSVATDLSGTADTGAVQGTISRGRTNGPLLCTPTQHATTFVGKGYISTPVQVSNPQNFSVVAWFKTTAASGGGILGFGNTQSGPNSTGYDRLLYVANQNGGNQLYWGICGGKCQGVVHSQAPVDNGQWHMAVGTIGPSGQYLYLTGQLVGADTSQTAAQGYNGWWQIGEHPGLSPWDNEPTGGALFTGSIAQVAVVPSVLNARQVQSLYTDAGYSSPSSQICNPAQGAPYDSRVQNASALAYWQLTEQAGAQANSSQSGGWGNLPATLSTGTIGSGGAAVPTSGPLAQCPTVNGGGALSFNGSGAFVTPGEMGATGNSLTMLAWVKTTAGGGVMGLDGPTQSDHFVYVGKNGRVYFDPSNSSGTAVTSAQVTVNNGQWHLVAVEDVTGGVNAGSSVYVDGNLVGYGPSANGINSSAHWEIGGIASASPAGCSGTSCPASANFQGSLSRVAVLNTVLSPSQLRTLYGAATGNGTPSGTSCFTNAMDAGANTGGSTPQAAYLLNDGAGSFADSSGNGHTATGSNVPSTNNTPGPVGCNSGAGAVGLNGSGYITLPTPFGTGWNPGSFTAGTWFKMNGSWGGNPRFFANDHTDSTNRGFQLEMNGGGHSGFFNVANGGSQVSANWTYGPGIQAGQWYYYAGSFTHGTAHAYIFNSSGTLVVTVSAGNGNVNTMAGERWPVNLGRNPAYNGDYVNGQMADATIYPTALSRGLIASQVNNAVASYPGAVSLRSGTASNPATYSSCSGYDAAVLGLGPSSYWEMVDGSGASPNVADQSGNGNNGTFYTGAPTTGVYPGPLGCGTTTPPSSTSSPAMRFSGGDRVGTPNRYSNPETMTLTAWFKTTSAGGIMGLGGNGYDRMLWVDNSGNLVWGTCGSTCPQEVISPQNVADGQWHFVVATVGAAGKHLYLTGRQVAANGITNAQPTLTGTWYLGSVPSTNGWGNGIGNLKFTGTLGRLGYVPQQLTAGQAGQLYVAGLTPSPPLPPSNYTTGCGGYDAAVMSLNPSAYWELNDVNGQVADQSGSGNTIGGLATGITQKITPGPLQCYLADSTDPTGWSTSFAGGGHLTSPKVIPGPQNFSIAFWFASYGPGTMVSFGSSPTGGGSYDRAVYVGVDGHLYWGTYNSTNGGLQILRSSQVVLTGQWHMAVATIGPSGMQLYVDGKSANTVGGTAQPYGNNYTYAQPYSGRWLLGGWSNTWGVQQRQSPNAPFNFEGELARVAIIPSVLSATGVRQLYGNGIDSLGGGGGGASALCLEKGHGSTCAPTMPHCSSSGTVPCVLAVAGGGGGGGSTEAGCNTQSVAGGDAGALYYAQKGTTTTGTYIKGNGAGNTPGAGGAIPGMGLYSFGTPGTFGAPPGSGGGGAGFAGGVGGPGRSQCGGGGGSSWFAHTLKLKVKTPTNPTKTKTETVTVTLVGNGPNTCTVSTTTTTATPQYTTSTSCPGSVTLSGPTNVVSYSVTPVASRPVGLNSTTWSTGSPG